jgi:hypothetical protein
MLRRGQTYLLLVLFIHLLTFCKAGAQVTAYTVQGFDFGSFYQGNTGGTINVSTEGTRTTSGDIILIKNWLPALPAIFEITAPQGTSVSILMGSDSNLSGSNGGTISLHLSGTDLQSPFLTSAVEPARTRIKVAGKLIIGNRMASPPGLYQGTCSITFNQE